MCNPYQPQSVIHLYCLFERYHTRGVNSQPKHITTQPEPDLVFRVQVDISDLTNRWVRCGSNMFLLLFNQPYKTILQATHGAHKNTEANLHGFHQQYILDLNSRPEHITTQPEPELVIQGSG